MELIDDSIHLAKEKGRTDAEFYKVKPLNFLFETDLISVDVLQVQKQAEANRLLLTQEFLELKRIEAMANNNKVYFGPDIPNMFIESKDRDPALEATR